MDTKDIKECPDCASTNIIHETFRDQVICRDCGLIFEPLTPQVQAQYDRAHEGLPPLPKPAVKLERKVKVKKRALKKRKPKKAKRAAKRKPAKKAKRKPKKRAAKRKPVRRAKKKR